MDKIVMNNRLQYENSYIKFKKLVLATISTTLCVNSQLIKHAEIQNLNSATNIGWFSLATESETES